MTVLPTLLPSCWLLVLKGQRRVPKNMIAIEVFVDGELWLKFPRVTDLLRIQAVFTVRQVFDILPCCWASRKPITSGVEFKFVARQVETSVVIRAANRNVLQKVELESTAATCCLNLQHRILLRDKLVTNVVNTRNNVFQLAMQKSCETSWRKMLSVLPNLYVDLQFIHLRDYIITLFDFQKLCTIKIVLIML